MADGQPERSGDIEALLEEAVSQIWGDVLVAVNKLLEADVKFGFSKIEANLNPSIEEIVHSLGVIELMVSMMMDTGLLDHDQTRSALNSKQCILMIRRVAEALRSKDKDEYADAMHMLDKQPKF